MQRTQNVMPGGLERTDGQSVGSVRMRAQPEIREAVGAADGGAGGGRFITVVHNHAYYRSSGTSSREPLTWYPFRGFNGTDLIKENGWLHEQIWPPGQDLSFAFWHQRRRNDDIQGTVDWFLRVVPTLRPQRADLTQIITNMTRSDIEGWARLSDNLDEWATSRKLSGDKGLWSTQLGRLVGPRMLPANPEVLHLQPLDPATHTRQAPLNSAGDANDWLRGRGAQGLAR